MIKVENLTKKYGDLAALDGVSFEMREGEVIGVLGPNGAGKTTLLRMLVTFLEPTSGNVIIDNLNINNPVASAGNKKQNRIFARARPFV